MLQQAGYLPVSELCERLGISEATARRDLESLARAHKITRTYGGAVVEPPRRFASFQERQGHAAEAKRRIALAAHKLIVPGTTVYLDVGTTIFAIAELLQEKEIRPLTVVTSSLPIAEVLAGAVGMSVHLLGGELLARQSALLGPMARRVLRWWQFDLALLSVEGITGEGLWNTAPEIVAHQRAVLRQAQKKVFCVNAAKIGRKAPELLMKGNAAIHLLTDASAARVRRAGLALGPGRHLPA